MIGAFEVALTYIAVGIVGYAIAHAWLWYMMRQMGPWHFRAAQDLQGICHSFGIALSLLGAIALHSHDEGLVRIALAVFLGHVIFPANFMVVTTILKILQLAGSGYDKFLRSKLGDLSEGYKEDNK